MVSSIYYKNIGVIVVKKLLTSYIVSFVFCFMVCLYEPIGMYISNINDFTFDIYIIAKPLMYIFILMFIGLCLFFSIVYFVNKKISNNDTCYKIILLLFSTLFICLFIEGNYLTSNLPNLDGSNIEWNNYLFSNVISIVVWGTIFVIMIFFSSKYTIEKVIRKVPLICSAILFLLILAICLQFFNEPSAIEKKVLAVSTENLDIASTNNNFFILLVDSVDGVMFDEVITKNPEYEKVFEDFTFYKNTTSTYLYTRDSVPYILTGKWNKNEKSFSEYYSDSLDNSYLIKELEKNDYKINLYESELLWKSDKAKSVSNLKKINQQIDKNIHIKEQMKYILFKYLPFPLKKYSKIESLNLNKGRIADGIELFKWSNIDAYSRFKNNKLELTDEKIFKFIHLEGAHVPFNQNKNVQSVDTGNVNYYDELEATITVIKSFLKQLKDSNVYDNSSIIILSDHGYSLGKEVLGRQNPILFIKGIDEHHNLIKSNLPISYTDLDDVYSDLLKKKKSSDLFKNIDLNRKRKIILYEYLNEDHMEEFIQLGNAWDEKTLVSTGKEYNR